MAVAYDSQISGSGNGANSYTVSLSTGGTNRLIIVSIHTSNNTALVPSATGLTFVQVGANLSYASNGEQQIYRAFASSQLSALTVTLTGSANPQSSVEITTFSGTDTTGTNGSGAIGATNTVTSAGAASSSAAVTTTRDLSLVIGAFAQTNSTTMTAGTSQTIRSSSVTQTFSRGIIETQNSTTTPSGTSVTCNITLGATVPCGGMTLEVLPPVAAVVTIPNKIRFINQAVNRGSNY